MLTGSPSYPPITSSFTPRRNGSGGYISFAKEQVVDSSRWFGDREVEILAYLSAFDRFSPKDLMPQFCSNRKVAYNYVQRLARKGFVVRVARGVYRVAKEKVEHLISRLPPVRAISKGRNARKAGGRQADGTRVPLSSGSGGVSGVFLDNVRYYVGGLFCRGRGWGVGCLASADRVSYFEVARFVGGLVVDGHVVIYTNRSQDPGAVKVEWRPPRGYVKRNGVASSLLMAREELVVAFRALAAVLGEALGRRRLSELYSWLGRLWGVV